jgi:hypothetical protein
LDLGMRLMPASLVVSSAKRGAGQPLLP